MGSSCGLIPATTDADGFGRRSPAHLSQPDSSRAKHSYGKVPGWAVVYNPAAIARA